MRTLDLIKELWDASEPADRCPHLQHDACGCSCSVVADPDTSRIVCDHISLQLWCLAGPDRWPVCASYPSPDGSAGRADVVVAYREFIDGTMRPIFEQPSSRQYLTDDDGLPVFGVYNIPPEEYPGGIIVEARPVGVDTQ